LALVIARIRGDAGEMLMSRNPHTEAAPRWADNSHGWPALAAMLVPSAGCDCQMLALVIADSLETSCGDTPPALPRMTEQ
jgi:hypothetical protein